MAANNLEIRDRIKTAVDRRTQPLVVEEWGIKEEDGCILKGLAAKHRGKLERMVAQAQEGRLTTSEIQAWAVIYSCFGPDGQPLFTEADVQWLQDKDAGVMSRLFEQVQDVSGLNRERAEEARKNSANGQTYASSSRSPAT